MMTKPADYTIIGLDVGHRRIGVARANSLARLPQPLTIVAANQQQFTNLQTIIDQHQPKIIVVGLPRNMEGLETKQSQLVKHWLEQFKGQVKTQAQLELTDETLSSVEARQRAPERQHIDDLAACVILDNYLGNPVVLQN